MKKKKESFFWTSYSDLMTSLFFIMMVLFVLAILLQHNQLKKSEQDRIATQEQLEKITEIEKSVQNIDKKYFSYDDDFKRHTLKNINVSFQTGSSNFNDIDYSDRQKLLEAGKAIKRFLNNAKNDLKTEKVEYMLIIEGQSSKDNYNTDIFHNNDVLSYQRALSLVQFWKENNLDFDNVGNCEVLVSGSGQRSKFRIPPDVPGNKKNQRFVIHIIPKPGIR